MWSGMDGVTARALVAALVAATGCHAAAAPDAAGVDRPAIDRAPYDQLCTTPPDSCPSPYVCIRSERTVPTPMQNRCYVRCPHGDGDCPDGFLCNGVTYGVYDLGPPRGYCFDASLAPTWDAGVAR